MFLLFFLVHFVLAAAFSFFLKGWLLLGFDVCTVRQTLATVAVEESVLRGLKLACASVKVKKTCAATIFSGAW